jgi:hypothetical protein
MNNFGIYIAPTQTYWAALGAERRVYSRQYSLPQWVPHVQLPRSAKLLQQQART